MRISVLSLLAATALALTACGGDDDDSRTADAAPSTEAPPTTETAQFPVTVVLPDGTLTIQQQPERIVSLAPALTEMLYAIGAGEQVEAVDELSNHPAEAPRTALSGFAPNVEAIAGYQPDLVVLSDDIEDVVTGLRSLEIPTIVLGAAQTLDETYVQIETLGTATGHAEEAVALTEQMRADVDEIVASLPQRAAPLTYYHELDDTLYTVTSHTFIGQIYALAGLENVADEAGSADSPYPQLSPEFLLAADPDLIFLADTKCCGQNAQTVAGRPGFSDLTAVRTGQVIELDDDIASRWGPRVVDFLTIVADAVANAPVPAA